MESMKRLRKTSLIISSQATWFHCQVQPDVAKIGLLQPHCRLHGLTFSLLVVIKGWSSFHLEDPFNEGFKLQAANCLSPCRLVPFIKFLEWHLTWELKSAGISVFLLAPSRISTHVGTCFLGDLGNLYIFVQEIRVWDAWALSSQKEMFPYLSNAISWSLKA